MPLALGVGAVWGLKTREYIKKRLALLVGVNLPNFASLSMHLRFSNALSRRILSLVFPQDFCAYDRLNQFISAIFKSQRIL